MSGEGNENAVREFTYFLASEYRPARIEKMLSGIHKTLCGIYRLLKRRKRLKKLRRETHYPLCNMTVFWVTTPSRNLTRKNERQQWGKKLIKCDVSCQNI